MAEPKDAPKAPEIKKEGERRPVSILEPWDVFAGFPYMQRFAEELDHLFEDFGMLRAPKRRPGLIRRMLGRTPEVREEGPWMPRVEVKESEGQFIIRAELPGLSKEDIKVEVTDEAVIIEGEREEEKKEEKKGYHYNECRYGSFYRSIPLPEGVEAAKAEAEFRNGVLQVVMPGPKHPEKQARALEIKGE